MQLDETYWELRQNNVVNDCDYGVGEEFQFVHDGRVLAFTVYRNTQRISLTDVTDLGGSV